MLLKFKTYTKKIPAKQGPEPIKSEVPFNEEEERKSILLMLGIDSDLSDEELDGFKTAFAPTFSDILSDDVEDYPVKDYLDVELAAKKVEIDKINAVFLEDYEKHVDQWENGSEIASTLTLPHDPQEAEDLIKSTEELEGFIEWTGESQIEEVDPQLEKLTSDDIKLDAYKIGDKYVLCQHSPNSSKTAELQLLATENNLEFSKVGADEVPVSGDNVLSIFQFYEYVDGQRENINETVLDMLIDEGATESENENLVPNAEQYPNFASKTRVEKFDGNSVLDQLGDL